MPLDPASSLVEPCFQPPVRPLALPARRLAEVEPSSTRVLASAFSASCAAGPIVQAAAVQGSAGSSRRRRGALRIRSARILRALRRDAHANARHEFAGWPRSPRFPRRISGRPIFFFILAALCSRAVLSILSAPSASLRWIVLRRYWRGALGFPFSIFRFPLSDSGV